MQDHLILASLRTEHQYTQQQLADFLNVSLSTYKLYETGTLPLKLEELNTLSNIYQVSFDYLLGFSKFKNVEPFRKSIDYRYLRFCIRFLRKRARLNQKSLAKEFEVSVYTISKYERDGQKVNLNYLALIAKKFQISADYICGKSLKKEVL